MQERQPPGYEFSTILDIGELLHSELGKTNFDHAGSPEGKNEVTSMDEEERFKYYTRDERFQLLQGMLSQGLDLRKILSQMGMEYLEPECFKPFYQSEGFNDSIHAFLEELWKQEKFTFGRFTLVIKWLYRYIQEIFKDSVGMKKGSPLENLGFSSGRTGGDLHARIPFMLFPVFLIEMIYSQKDLILKNYYKINTSTMRLPEYCSKNRREFFFQKMGQLFLCEGEMCRRRKELREDTRKAEDESLVVLCWVLKRFIKDLDMENQIPPNYPNHDPLRRRLNNFEASGLFLNYLTKEAKGCKIVPFLPLVLMLGPVAALKIKKIWKIIPGPFQHLSQNFLSATSALFSLLGDPNAEVPQLIISSGLEQSLIKLNSSSRTVVNGILSKGQGEEVILNAPELLKRVSPLTDFPCHLRYQGIDEDVKMFLQKRDIQRPRVPFGEHRGLACLVWLRFFENKLGLILDPNMYEDLRKEFPLLLTSQIEMMWTKIYGPIIRPVYVGKQVRQATRLLMVLDILDYLDDEEHGNFRKLFSDRYVVQWVLQGRSNHS